MDRAPTLWGGTVTHEQLCTNTCLLSRTLSSLVCEAGDFQLVIYPKISPEQAGLLWNSYKWVFKRNVHLVGMSSVLDPFKLFGLDWGVTSTFIKN